LAALVLSLTFHVTVVVPRILSKLILNREQQVEVAYVPEIADPQPSDTADEKPPEPADDKQAAAPKPATVEAPKAPAPEPAEVARVEPPKPQPPAQAVPVPPPPTPPPPSARMQFVDQDKFHDEADNADARYLAQKNHKAEKDSSAKNTNLIREVEAKNEKSASEPSDNKSDEIGGKEDKIAELENRAGPDKTMPRSSPMQGEEGTRPDAAKPKPGPLSMRDLTPRSSTKPVPGQKVREGVEVQEEAGGTLPMARIGHDGERARRAAEAAKGGAKVKLTLDHHDYDHIEGYGTAEKERQAGARAELSHKKGRYDRYLSKLQAMRSSIENFTMEVKPGNQAELGTRKHPFAGYITAMHRQIHKLFAFGFLSDIESKSSSNSPYNDLTLWAKLEIVVNPDGSVERVGLVHASGVTGFDVAAIDSVMSAAPFPVPPKDIRSANGKVYLHWQFHRDDSACITTGVDPFILTTPGEVPKDVSANISEGKPGRIAPEPPRSLKREKNEGEHEHATATAPPQPAVPEVTEEVRAAAEGWFAAYARGDAAWLAGWSATPFTAAGEVVAKDAPALKSMYKQLLAEAPKSRLISSMEVLTPAGVRGRLGGLPPGGESDNMLFAVGKAGGEEFVLLLKKSSRGWRVAGIAR
jgi:TonB family protein